MPAISRYGPTGNPYIDGVMSGVKWASTALTYSFPASAGAYGANYGDGEPQDAFGVLNTAQKTATRDVLANIASSVNLTFTELTGSAAPGATLRYASSDAPGTAWGYYPDTDAEAGDSWYNNSSGQYDSPVKGDYAYMTFLHETGHTLGLDHAHSGYAVPVGRDSMEYTVMSYRSFAGASVNMGYTNENFGFAQSLMMYDIAALQYLYGANYATNAGDSVYSWSPTTGQMSINGAAQSDAGGNKIFMTLWDGGGIDSYDLSNYSTNLRIDLRPGEWTTTSAAQLASLFYDGSRVAVGNIANALLYTGSWMSLIENAEGGSGNDAILGNQTANTLWGNGGNDALAGGDGHDTLIGGPGGDMLTGGAGFDIASYAGAATGVLAELLLPAYNTGEAAGDRYATIEGIVGTSFADTLRGNEMPNTLIGGDGDDVLYGRGGNDALFGGNDNDALIGMLGMDLLDGGAGVDIASYGIAASYVIADLLNPMVNAGEARGDGYVSIENLFGSAFADGLWGTDAANVIFGAGGNDALFGRGGNDTLLGGEGNDTLLGLAGADHLDGGNGMDLASYAYAPTGLMADLLTPGINTGEAAGDSYLSIENVMGSAFGDDLRGDAMANILYGGGGDDMLSGRAGNDILAGGEGHDTLMGGEGADMLQGGNGIDMASYVNAAGAVLVDMQFASLNTGEAAGDRFSAIERLYGSGFDDSLRGDDYANVLYGAGGTDILYARGGNDFLIGGEGADALFGNAGADVFLYIAAGDSQAGAADTIWDFAQGADKIDLRLIDADANAGSDQAFSFISGAAFSGTAGELHFAGGVLAGDIDGDSAADFQINILNIAMLHASDILL
ncbi:MULTISPECIES: M10 family metallopeptidase [Rhodomicrobium]|uniref:M10 family metallopeptidase n=1 Tax=Rhodomicrobium TaxID=1068 RepID=UPI000B4B7F19|nr:MULTISPECIES: M10 family metallopeptidase [Rhodomicrobium]